MFDVLPRLPVLQLQEREHIAHGLRNLVHNTEDRPAGLVAQLQLATAQGSKGARNIESLELGGNRLEIQVHIRSVLAVLVISLDLGGELVLFLLKGRQVLFRNPDHVRNDNRFEGKYGAFAPYCRGLLSPSFL